MRIILIHWAQGWHVQGQLERVDLVCSRDQIERRYVQHRVLECGDELKRWVREGAAIYVCGSLKGMAPAVDAALSQVRSADTLEELAVAGRYGAMSIRPCD